MVPIAQPDLFLFSMGIHPLGPVNEKEIFSSV